MTITNTVASKLFVGFVAIAMALSLVAPAKAATEAELQAQIDQLMATINALQSQVGQTATTGGSSASVCPYAWTRSLTTGATGADVMALQQFLNADPMTQVAASGVGSAGMETDYFGGMTAAAVSNFQVKYRDEILTPAGLVNPTGYFGPSTMAKANALCASAPVAEEEEEAAEEEEDDMTLQGEGALKTFEVDDDESEVMEGAEDVVVAVLTMEAEDGDLRMDRITMTLVDAGGSVNDETDPWDVFDEVTLWVDGDKIASFEADDEDNYLDEDAGEFRFSSLGLILEEDEEVEVEVAVSVASSVDGAAAASATTADWDISITEVRYFDADDVATTDDTTDDLDDTTPPSEEFDIVEEGTDDGADVDSNSDNPDASTLLVDDGTDDSDEYTVFIFDIEVDEDSSDLEVGDTYLDVTISDITGGAGVAGGQEDVIDAIYMTIDGETVEGEATTGGTNNEDTAIGAGSSTEVEYLFEFDQDVVLEGDTDYEVEVSVVFKGQDGNYVNGTTIDVAVNGSTWEVEGLANDDELTGSESSETHTLADVVAIISDASFDVDRNEAGDAGTISYEFTMEADGENDIDFNIANKSDVQTTGDDITFSLSGTDTTIATATISLLSGDATSDASGWTIADGDEATFVLDVTFTTVDSGDNGTYRVTIDTIEGLEIDETSSGLNLTN